MRPFNLLLAGIALAVATSAAAKSPQPNRFMATIYIAEWSKLRHNAELGDVNSQFQLANYYFQPPKGTTLPQSYNKAARFYRMAALQNHGPSQHNLGVLLLKGQGVDRNRVEARAWFSLAAQQGFAAARQALEILDRNLSETDHQEALRVEQKLKQQVRQP